MGYELGMDLHTDLRDYVFKPIRNFIKNLVSRASKKCTGVRLMNERDILHREG